MIFSIFWRTAALNERQLLDNTYSCSYLFLTLFIRHTLDAGKQSQMLHACESVEQDVMLRTDARLAPYQLHVFLIAGVL